LGCIFLSIKSRDSNPKGHQASRKPSWMVFSEMVQACLTGAGRRTHQRVQSPSCLTKKNTLLLGCIFLSIKSRDSNPKGHQASRKPSWMVFSEMVQACLTGAGRRTH